MSCKYCTVSVYGYHCSVKNKYFNYIAKACEMYTHV